MFVHIISRDKFTNGYIKFIKSQIPQYEHVFFTFEGDYSVEFSDNVNEIVNIELFFSENYELLEQSVAIIYSGVLNRKLILGLMKERLISKTYFHFWGGDFYCYRRKSKNPLEIIMRKRLFIAFRRAKGLLFLIPGEYEAFNKITHVVNNNFVAPMCGDPAQRIDYARYRNEKHNSSPQVRIVVGNSASESNYHEEVLIKLKHLNLNNTIVYCPLSYGSPMYRDHIIEIGQELIGDSFHPITEFMSKEDYMSFLSSMDLGIFNNDRQQAMGNINSLIGMGKKVYLRKGTSMWNNYVSLGYRVFPIDDIDKLDIEQLRFFSANDQTNNTMVFDKVYSVDNNRHDWEVVFFDAMKDYRSIE